MEKIVRNTLADQIAEQIQTEIIRGTWKPGDRLPSENRLAEMLGVSRMSLRSGIQKCNALGITETHIGDGTYVRDFSMRSYFSNITRMNMVNAGPKEINDARYMIQIGSVLFALQDGIDEERIRKLETLYQIMEESERQNDMEAFHQADMDFHMEICRLGNNPLIDSVYDAMEYLLSDIVRMNTEKSVEYYSGIEMVHRHHRQLLDAIRTKDIKALIQAVWESRARASEYYRE